MYIKTFFMKIQLAKFEHDGGNKEEWLNHTEKTIIQFIKKANSLTPHPWNFWGNVYTVRNYTANTQQALVWIRKERYTIN